MTFGEAALFLAKSTPRSKKATVTISSLDNWAPEFLFDACSLPWVAPSPNIPNAKTALLYVGMCLFEGTNLNEGRGTDTPFALIGAPWLKADAIIKRIQPEESAGCSLEAVRYTPEPIPEKAENPVYKGHECNGIKIDVTDADAVRAFTLAVALLSAIHALHPKEFEWKKSFDVLAGSPDLRARIEKGENALAIAAECEKGLGAYQKLRVSRYV
jgi:uncharacterized protein YbbC (DUF1343 family)